MFVVRFIANELYIEPTFESFGFILFIIEV